MKQHVMVGMSGGVDSSVSAWLLQQQGYQVSGLFMKNWEEDDTAEYCSASVDLADAQAVADQLKIPLHTVNFATEYWDNVFTYFLQEYQAGRTPNPDIMCNREIKFKAFLEFALDLGADCIATGHYAQCRQLDDGNYQMHKGLDNQKDQTYFLYTLQQDQLAKSLFPLGQLKKSLVRKIAQEQNFQTAQKKDSTGICFIGERKFRDFLARFLPAQPGEIISVAGEKLGQHQGLMYYTLGQRQGLGIGGRQSTTNAPWFVVEKLLDTNQLIVAQGHQNQYLLKQGVTATQLYWVAGHPPRRSFRCWAKTRYRQQEESCQVTVDDNGDVQVYFLQPQRAPTPGQSIVFYTDDICLGGGVIEKTQTNGLQDTD